MKNQIKKIKIEALKLENGNIILGHNAYENEFFVQTTDGIMTYTAGEMKEIYNYSK